METEEKAPTKLAIGVEGGFSAGVEPKGELVKEYSLALLPLPGGRIPYPSEASLPPAVAASVSLRARTARAGAWLAHPHLLLIWGVYV